MAAMTEPTTYDYVPEAGPRQRLDVFGPAPELDLNIAVLVLHGGAFRNGDRSGVHARCRALAERGFTAIAVGYRLLDSAPWPAQLDDVRSAVRWVHEKADEHGIAADHIVLQGHSAGAQLALLVAGTAGAGRESVLGDPAPVPAVAAVVAYYGPAAMTATGEEGALPAQALLGADVTAEDASAASPISHVKPGYPPTALFHGTGDRFIPVGMSMRLFDVLTAAEVPSELHLIANQDHEFDLTPRFTEITSDVTTAFLRAQVVEPEQVAKEVLDNNPLVSLPPPGSEPASAEAASS